MFTNKSAAEGAQALDGAISFIPDDLRGESSSVDDQLLRLMDLLATVRVNLTTGIMPRAARITGTSDRLYGAVDNVDAAIRVTKNVVTQLHSLMQNRA